MGVALKQVRSLIAAKVAELTDYRLSPHVPSYFGRTQDSIAHKAYTVDIVSTNAANERQRRGIVYCASTIRVTFAYRLRPLSAYPTDYDLALDAEQAILQKCLEAYSAELSIRYESTVRSVPDSSEYAIITLEFTVLHTLPT